MDCNFSFN